MRERVQCLIFREVNTGGADVKQLLLVRDNAANHFYPPGGGVDAGESYELAIARELQEELQLRVLSSTFYSSYVERNVIKGFMQKEINYFVEVSGTPVPSSEIEELLWVSWDDVVNGELLLPPLLKKELLIPLHEGRYF